MRILDEAAFLLAAAVFCCCVVLLQSCITQQKSKVLLKQFDLVRRPAFPFPSRRLKSTTTGLTAATPTTTTLVLSSPGRASASSTGSVVSSVPTTPTSPLPSTTTASTSPTPTSTAPSVTRATAELARDCGDVDLSSTISGTAVQRATVFRPGCFKARSCALNVSCDTSTDGGGWTIIQQRLNDDISFFRTWREYRDGFGDDTNFWIGNEYLFELTNSRPRLGTGAVKRDANLFSLSVRLTDFNNTSYTSTYDNFKLDNEANNYTLTLQKTSGTQADQLAGSSDGRPFGTFDAGADGSQLCALTTRSGWWHPKFCSHPTIDNLNAEYSKLYWSSGAAATKPFRIKEVQLKLRRRRPTETVI